MVSTSTRSSTATSLHRSGYISSVSPVEFAASPTTAKKSAVRSYTSSHHASTPPLSFPISVCSTGASLLETPGSSTSSSHSVELPFSPSAPSSSTASKGAILNKTSPSSRLCVPRVRVREVAQRRARHERWRGVKLLEGEMKE